MKRAGRATCFQDADRPIRRERKKNRRSTPSLEHLTALCSHPAPASSVAQAAPSFTRTESAANSATRTTSRNISYYSPGIAEKGGARKKEEQATAVGGVQIAPSNKKHHKSSRASTINHQSDAQRQKRPKLENRQQINLA